MATIRISDLHLRTIIGINDWERDVKQEIVINIAMEVDIAQAAKSDAIKDTVDYKALKKKIMHFVEATQFNLIERLAAQILKIVLSDKWVKAATVRVDKPQALRFARSVSVEVTQKQGSKLL